jgi:hypothetical protein
MASIDSALMLVACPDAGPANHGNAGPVVRLPARPGRDDLDPLLAEHAPRRIAVAGTDADLAAVLLRLLRTERLDIELAYLPAGRSPAATAWGLPTGAAAAELARSGTAEPVPLTRDDTGGVLVGRGEVRDLTGECYCDETLVLRGPARRLVVVPGPAGIAVRAGWSGRSPDGGLRPVPPTAARGHGSARGRAVQVGGRPATVIADGVAHPRPLERRTWYRHTEDWLLVRP